MQEQRKQRLQAAINIIKEVKQELRDGLYSEAEDALGQFDCSDEEYEIMGCIVTQFSAADENLEDAIVNLEDIFGKDGDGSVPASDDSGDSDDSGGDYVDPDEDSDYPCIDPGCPICTK